MDVRISPLPNPKRWWETDPMSGLARSIEFSKIRFVLTKVRPKIKDERFVDIAISMMMLII
jgi:hypothetical protein